MKVVVFGANGMAGHTITKYLRLQGYTVTTVARSIADIHLNIENIAHTEQTITERLQDYDFAVNCVGLLVKDSIARPDRAVIINSWFPNMLARVYKNTRTRVIHLSTDCVFDGRDGPYLEDAVHTEMNAYGRSKSLGEIVNDKDVTFRMSIIGTELKDNGTGLLHWALTTPQQELPGWENAEWNGVTTLTLAKCIDNYMQKPDFTGVYHLVNNSVSINKYELLTLINQVFDLKKTVVRTTGPKPVNKILVDSRQLRDFGIKSYHEQLVELRDFSAKPRV